MFAVGCSKKDGPQPTPTPTPKPAPVFTTKPTANPISTWYSGSVIISWEARNATSYTISSNGDNPSMTGTSYTTPQLISSTTYTITAKGDGGTEVATVTVRVLSQVYTKLIYATPPTVNTWYLYSYTAQKYPLAIYPVETLNPGFERIIFYPGDTCHLFLSKSDPTSYGRGTYSLPNDSSYVLSNLNFYHIIKLDNTMLKIETTTKAWFNPDDSSHYVREYRKL